MIPKVSFKVINFSDWHLQWRGGENVGWRLRGVGANGEEEGELDKYKSWEGRESGLDQSGWVGVLEEGSREGF